MVKKSPRPKYLVIRDTREKLGWQFDKSAHCLGTEVRTLETGDYTLDGYEKVFIIERKRSTGELAANLFQARFERELDRLDRFPHAYLVLEFEMADILSFPRNSGIPRSRWKSLKVTSGVLLKRLHEVQIAHPGLRILFVGKHGREALSSLFKRVMENV